MATISWNRALLAENDLGRSLDCYCGALGYGVKPEERSITQEAHGMTAKPRTTCGIAMLATHAAPQILELLQFRGTGVKDRGLAGAAGAGHIAFVVGDFEQAIAAVKRPGAEPISELTAAADGRKLIAASRVAHFSNSRN